MCVVSMIGDHYNDKWGTRPFTQPDYTWTVTTDAVTKAEFEALKKEVLEMKELLKRAKEYDEKHNEPDCEMEDKVSLLRKVAKLVGVDLEDLI